MVLEKQRFRSEYLLESAHKTLQVGSTAAWLSLPVLAGMTLQDIFILELDGTLPWRVIGLLPFVCFLAFRYLPHGLPIRLAIPLNVLNMLGILVMMSGIALMVLLDPKSSLLNQYGVSIGLATVLFVCLIIAAGARNSLVYLIPACLVLTSLALYFLGDQLGFERWGFLSNSYIIGILVVLFGILQERRSQRDFLLRKKIELREAQLSIKTTELEALNKSLESFSYSVSHDLRGPIRNMIGLSTLLQRKKNGDEEIQEITDTIVFNAHKMNQLVEDILSFAKASNAPINSRELNMTQLFEDAYAELREENDKREIHFELDPLKAANGDPSLIRQVVLNLLSNALKYTRQRAETHICVKGMEQEDGKYLYLVQDNGTGFDENRKAELFQPFKRLHEDTEFEGHGVGLAFSQKIVERHQGKLWAESVPNQGATFYFTLPMQTSQN